MFSANADEAYFEKGRVGCTFIRTTDSKFLTVDYVAQDSPSAKAGIQKDDDIVAINGLSTEGMSPTQAYDSIKGDIGSVVTLTVRRNGMAEKQVAIVLRSFLDTYLSAATAGDSRIQFYIGDFYSHGPTSTRDFAKAAEWYRKAADQGYTRAQVYLGYMYEEGMGVPKDLKEGVAWYLKAAKQGDAVGQRYLGIRYYYGEGVSQNDQEAFAWFYSAATQDDSSAELYLGILYRAGRGVVRDDREAFNWFYRSAQKNNPYGEWNLAYMYRRGRGVKRDCEEALKWYQKAQVSLPKNEKLKREAAFTSVLAFLKNPSSPSLSLNTYMATFRRQMLFLLSFLALAYVVGGIILFYFSFKVPEAPPKLSVAIGWMMFYIEGQEVALFAALIFTNLLTTDILLLTISLFSALPVIASSCGSRRNYVWRASQISWRTLLLYGVGSCLAILALSIGYDKIYTLITHSDLTPQSTLAFFTKAKHSSLWRAFISIGLALPIAEEIVFRSYLFDALRQRFSGKIVVIITALIFSLIHFQWLYFVPLFGFGLILGWLRLKTDSMRLPVFLHVINNGLVLIFAI